MGGSLVVAGGALKLAYKALGWELPSGQSKVPWPVWLFMGGALTHLGWEAFGGNRAFVERYNRELVGGSGKGLDLSEVEKRRKLRERGF